MNAEKNGHKVLGYAGFWRRVASYWLDWVWILPLYLLMFIDPMFGYMSVMVAGCVIVIVNIVLYYKSGQTIGYKILGLRIVNKDTGKKPSFGALLGRFFGKILAAIPLYLGLFWAGWDKKKQGWHDKMASTVVVREKPISSAVIWSLNIGITVLYFVIMGAIMQPLMSLQTDMYDSMGISTTYEDYESKTNYADSDILSPAERNAHIQELRDRMNVEPPQ